MRLKGCLKRIVAASLAAVVVVSSTPHDFIAYAADADEYADEVYFPISVLDFRQDNLFFEWVDNNNRFTLYNDLTFFGDENSRGKGLVENTLGADGTPVYTRETVEYIAKALQDALYRDLNPNGNINLDVPLLANGEENYLSVRNYIGVKGYEVIGKEYADQYHNPDALPEDYIQWKLNDNQEHTYGAGYSDYAAGVIGAKYWPHVWEEAQNNNPKALYSVEYNGLVLQPGVAVTKTLSDLSGQYYVSIGDIGENVSVSAIGADNYEFYGDNKIVEPDQNGEIKFVVAADDKSVSEPFHIEAEDTTMKTGNADKDPTYPDFVSNIGNGGKVRYRIYSSEAGTRAMYIYYATHSSSQRGYDIKVYDDNNNQIAYTSTGVLKSTSDASWFIVSNEPAVCNINLEKGWNIIEFDGINGAFAPNLAAFELQKNGFEYSSWPINENGWSSIEAEDYQTYAGEEADLDLNDMWTDAYTQCSGGAILNFNGNPGDHSYVTYKFYSETSGKRRVRLYYTVDDNGRQVVVSNDSINDTPHVVDFPNNQSWVIPAKKPVEVEIDMLQGWNTIRIAETNVAAPNLDRIEIETITGKNKIEDITLEPVDKYPLGDYEQSKLKFDGVTEEDTPDEETTTEEPATSEEPTTTEDGTLPEEPPTETTTEEATTEEPTIENGDVTQVGTMSYRGAPDDEEATTEVPATDEGATTETPTTGADAENPGTGDDMEADKMEKGWTDMTTCMDYAYFVTSNLFKSNPTLNDPYNDYSHLIFHKVVEGEEVAEGEDGTTSKIAYEFAASKKRDIERTIVNEDGEEETITESLPVEEYDLIFNKEEKTVRNAYNGDVADTTKGDVPKPGGQFFICDDAVSRYGEKDPQLNGGKDNKKHNFHFTISSRSKFVYKQGAGQYFFFSGDDDVYVYVNGNLLVDLGGAHPQLNGEFNLDELAKDPKYGLVNGQVVDLAFFYMERHAVDSNFYAKMNFKLANDGLNFDIGYDTIPYGFLIDLNYQLASSRELTTNRKFTFTDTLGNKIGYDGFELGEGVFLKSQMINGVKYYVLEVIVENNGVKVPGKQGKFIFADPHNPTDAEVQAVKDFFAKLELGLNETLELNGLQYDTAHVAYDNLDDGSDENTKNIAFDTTVTYQAQMDGAEEIENKLTVSSSVEVIVGSITVYTDRDEESGNLVTPLLYYGDFDIIRTDDTVMVHTHEMTFNNNVTFGDGKLYQNPTTPDGSRIVELPQYTDIKGNTYSNIPAGEAYVINKVPIGRYRLSLDPSVLTGYDVYLNDELVPQGTIDLIPEYINGEWKYPKVEFKLKATRPGVELRSLT